VIGSANVEADRIKTASEDRNAYVHGVWQNGPEPKTATVQTVRLNRAEIVRDELVTCADLTDLAAEIEDITQELRELARRLGFLSS
jgi:hypothetical protein